RPHLRVKFCDFRFQSSPSRMAGRYEDAIIHGTLQAGFNPRPAEWPGATKADSAKALNDAVSILAQPNGRALRVSTAPLAPSHAFQSSPSRMAGRYWMVGLPSIPALCFNPRP